MLPTKEEIKRWMKDKKIKRDELACLLKVSKDTVNNWMAKRKIPTDKLLAIGKLMGYHEVNHGIFAGKRISPDTECFVLKFTKEEWKEIQEFMLQHPQVNIQAMAEEAVLQWASSYENRKLLEESYEGNASNDFPAAADNITSYDDDDAEEDGEED